MKSVLDEPLVSLIIPVYDVKPYLRQCLDSVVSQKYDHLEILIVDDGSTDGSGEICEEYAEADPRITVYHTENGGLSAARNFGLDHMSPQAEYVLFLDSDDWIEPDTVRTFCDAVARCPADIVACRYWLESRSASRLSSELDQSALYRRDAVMKNFLTGKGGFSQVAWNKLYRADLFSSIRYPVGRAFEDIATTFKLFGEAEKVLFIPDVLFHYRLRNNSLSRTDSLKTLVDLWDVNYQKYKDLSGVFEDEECERALIGGCLTSINRMLRCYMGLSAGEKREAADTIAQMKTFAAEHRRVILRGKAYSAIQKMTCVCAMSANPVMMWGINKIYRVCLRYKRKGRYAGGAE